MLCVEQTLREAGRKLTPIRTIKSLHGFTHARLQNGEGSGKKSNVQSRLPTPNFPCLFWNHKPQTTSALTDMENLPNKQGAHSAQPAKRICKHTHGSREWECQNPPVFTPQHSAHVWAWLKVELCQLYSSLVYSNICAIRSLWGNLFFFHLPTDP